MSTAPAGRIVASSRAARSAESCRGAPPGRRSRSRRCSRLIGAAALGGQLVAAIGEQPQHGAVVVGRDAREVVAVLGDERDAARVDAVGLAAVAALEHAGAGGQRRGDVDDGLAGGDELLGQQPSQAAGALDRPDALRPSRGPRSQPRQRRAVGRHAQLAERGAGRVERDRGVRALVGIDADGDHWRCSSRPTTRTRHRGGQPEFEQQRSRLYRATPTAGGDRAARYETATPRRARSVRANTVTVLAR